MNTDFNPVRKSANRSILVMLSGGKDSVASLVMLQQEGFHVEAVHFIHRWGSSIPTQEAKRICEERGIKLHVVDFSPAFLSAINMHEGGRPCLLCKKQMYRELNIFMRGMAGKFGWICVGDNADDQTTIQRLDVHLLKNGGSRVCSDYLGGEMGCRPPAGVNVVRPLIAMRAIEVETFLLHEGIEVRRIGSTGDKYFEYYREGCPAQFVDYGVAITPDLLLSLKEFNDCITEFARCKGIRASVHMPSGFIVTIPSGYEQEAAEYLNSHGLPVPQVAAPVPFAGSTAYACFAELFVTGLWSPQLLEKLFLRFVERLSLTQEKSECADDTCFFHGTCESPSADIEMVLNKKRSRLSLVCIFKTYQYCGNMPARLENLLVELFRTRNFKIVDISGH